MKGFKNLAVAAIFAVVGAAFAQDSTSSSSTEQMSSSTTLMGSARSDGAAIASILSRRSPAEASAILKALANLEQKQSSNPFGTDNGFGATRDLILGSLSGSDADTLRTAWQGMNDFDQQGLTILARAAWFGGFGDENSQRPLRIFSDNSTTWVRSNVSPAGIVRSPDWRAYENVVMKMGSYGETFKAAVDKIEAGSKSGAYKNLGYMNAEKILVNALPSDARDSFISNWKSMDYSDREAALIIVRDAYLNGIGDL